MSIIHDQGVATTTAAALVLPWENRTEYDALLQELAETYRPQGATERFLIEELAALMWRKRRLSLAEAASFRDGLKHVTMQRYASGSVAEAALVPHVRKVATTSDAVQDALLLSDQETVQELAAIHDVGKKVHKALRLLHDGKPHPYERALKALPLGTREWWDEVVEAASGSAGHARSWEEEEANWHMSPESLTEFLETEVVPWVEQRETALTYRADIRLQAFGEALRVRELVNLARYEAHLTSQFRQTLTMLIELQQQRRETVA
jgi:hypothetical protein